MDQLHKSYLFHHISVLLLGKVMALSSYHMSNPTTYELRLLALINPFQYYIPLILGQLAFMVLTHNNIKL